MKIRNRGGTDSFCCGSFYVVGKLILSVMLHNLWGQKWEGFTKIIFALKKAGISGIL